MESYNGTSPVRQKILWDISADDNFQTIMFNDNGIWFQYDRKVSLNRLKSIIRELAKEVPIQAVKIRPVSEIGVDNCEYRCIYSSHGLIVSKQPKDPDEDDLAYRDLSNKELASLLGNPSRLLADYWDELYDNSLGYHLYIDWEDGNEDREPNSASLGAISLSVSNDLYMGTLEQIDEDTGVVCRCKWSIRPDLKGVVRRAQWLGKGNSPEPGL